MSPDEFKELVEHGAYIEEGFRRLVAREKYGNDVKDGVVVVDGVRMYVGRDLEGKGTITWGPGVTSLDEVFLAEYPNAKEGDLIPVDIIDRIGRQTYSDRYLKTARKHPDLPPQFIAPLTSFEYNTGGDIATKAPASYSALNRVISAGGSLYEEDGYTLTEDALDLAVNFAGSVSGFVKEGGKFLPGLQNRRLEELGDMFGEAMIPAYFRAALYDAGEAEERPPVPYPRPSMEQ